jgi:hypothetical protein
MLAAVIVAAILVICPSAKPVVEWADYGLAVLCLACGIAGYIIHWRSRHD